MKRLLIVFAVFISGSMLFGQGAGINNLYYSYKGEEGVIAMRLPGFVLRLAGSVADLDPAERQLLRSMRSVSILTIEEESLYPGVNFIEELDPYRLNDDYQVLMEVHDSTEDVLILAREKNGRIRDLIVLVGGDDNVMVHVRGRINRDLIRSIADVAGVEQLRFTREIADPV